MLSSLRKVMENDDMGDDVKRRSQKREGGLERAFDPLLPRSFLFQGPTAWLNR